MIHPLTRYTTVVARSARSVFQISRGNFSVTSAPVTTAGRARRVLSIGLVVTAVAFAAQAALITATRTESAPLGVLSLTHACRAALAEEITRSWSDGQRALVAFGLGFDYVGIVAYGATLGLLGAIVARGRSVPATPTPWTARLGVGLPWCAAACDSAENIAVLAMLAGRTTPTTCAAALVLSSLKWSCLTAWILALATCARTRREGRRRDRVG